MSKKKPKLKPRPKKSKPKKSSKKNTKQRKAARKGKVAVKRTTRARATSARKRTVGRSTETGGAAAFSPGSRRAGSGRLSGDLQGLSNVAGADSESVDELLEEGNAFEADAVAGVEAADDADEKEVRTHEVPEDDVPREYLDDE